MACREDKTNFCDNLPSDTGLVYKCLLEHKEDENMSKEVGGGFIALQIMVEEGVVLWNLKLGVLYAFILIIFFSFKLN